MAHQNISGLELGVLGAGSWGTALAMVLADKGYPVTLWAYENEVVEDIARFRENKLYLPGITLPENLWASSDISAVVKNKALVLFVVPSHLMRETAKRVAADISEDSLLVTASKGIENLTYKTMTGVLQEEIPHISTDNIAVLSGPSFAREVGEKRPTVVTLASKNLDVARKLQEVFASSVFRVYTSDDVIGVEVGGAMKNVIAIAAGVVDGLGLGLNTRAALITRGLTEIRRLGVAMGANPHTFSGLSGVGDLILTCTGSLSRNHAVGQLLGEGRGIDEILNEMHMVAEGVKSARSVYNLSSKLGVELPICNEVYRVIYEESSPAEAVERLMSRSLKPEFEGLDY